MDNPTQETPQSFTPAPLQISPILLKKPFLNRNRIILIAAGILLLGGMITFILVAPSKKTMVSPATLEAIPTVQTATQAPTLPVTLPPSLTPVPTLPSTAWNNYSNSTYGYSIKYPPTWKVINLGVLEPKIPSYVAFNTNVASGGARFVTISISTRTYQEQLALGASSSAITVAGIVGTKQFFQDSDGNTSTTIILPRTNNLLVLRVKTAYLPIFNQMLTTLQTTK